MMYNKNNSEVANRDPKLSAWYNKQNNKQEEKLNESLKKAKQGDARAQYILGLMYDYGQGAVQDYTQALNWYRKSAEQGVADAQYSLGVMYDNGKGVPKSNAQAFIWYSKAAEQGHAAAQNNLGAMYANGQGVAENYLLAYILFALAEKSDHEVAGNSKIRISKMLTSIQETHVKDMASKWKVGTTLPLSIKLTKEKEATLLKIEKIEQEKIRRGELPSEGDVVYSDVCKPMVAAHITTAITLSEHNIPFSTWEQSISQQLGNSNLLLAVRVFVLAIGKIAYEHPDLARKNINNGVWAIQCWKAVRGIHN